VAVTAGARGELVERIAQAMVDAQEIKIEKARELLAALSSQ
jgi:hydroxymethylglutaryl-CoA reductase